MKKLAPKFPLLLKNKIEGKMYVNSSVSEFGSSLFF